MPRCGQERGNVRPLPTAASPEPLAKDETPSTTDLGRLSSIHPSACVTRERAAAPAAASVLALESTDLRLPHSCTGLVNVKHMPRATILWGVGDERTQFDVST